VSDPAGDLALLRLLQLADSGFPSGAYTLSHGLETMVADGLLRPGGEVPGGLASLIRVHLLARYARADLVALLAAHGAGDTARVVAIDRRLGASKLAADDRRGSERVGRRLAAEVARLVPAASAGPLLAFNTAIEAGETPGNAAVAFGLAGEAFGIESRRTAMAAASAQVMGLAAAAVRLGLIGHAAGQRLIAGAAPAIVTAVELASAGDWRDLRPSAPELDVALARHERAPVRAFAS